MSIYEYTPLATDEIRLLTLQPGAPDSRIRISLHNQTLRCKKQPIANTRLSPKELLKTLPTGWTVWETVEGRIIFEHSETENTSWTHPIEGFDKSLYLDTIRTPSTSTVPSFEALSYTWGSEPDSIEVEVVKQTGPLTSRRGTLLIRPNLDAALRHLRDVDRPRTVWIDAVCINQSDLQERNEQVRRMTDVYRSATRVIIWVGTASDDSYLALSTLKLLGQQIEWTRDDFLVCHPDAIHRDWWRLKTVLTYDDTVRQACENLVQRPWFERLWIWQEVHLASNDSVLQCGSDCVEWSTFRRAVMRLHAAANDVSSRFTASFRLRIRHVDGLISDYTSTPFANWIDVTDKALCANPRDRIYGLLGLAPPGFANALKPDYSLPVGEVYKSTVLTELSILDTLTLLCQCDLRKRSVDAPSWVPDWSLTQTTQVAVGSRFLASGRSLSYASYVRPSSLTAHGVVCGTLSSITSPCQQDQLLKTLSTWAPPQMEQSQYVTGESLLDAFLLTLCGGEVAEHTDYSLHPTLIDLRSGLAAYTDSQVTGNAASGADIFLPGMSRWLPGKIFVTTREGYIGLAPHGTQTGDVVTVLLGCPLPMLLRPSLTGSYEVVGSGYFYGLMHGEGILGALPKGWTCKEERTDSGWRAESFYNHDASVNTFDDPRLEPLSSEWEIDAESTFSHRRVAAPKFVNKITGEVRETDPRLTLEAIRQRGVKLHPITLI